MLSVFALALMAGCGERPDAVNIGKDEELEAEEDETPPVIEHTPVDGTQTFGTDVPIEAVVTDDSERVQFVHLYYKNEVDGQGSWQRLFFTADPSTPGRYTTAIPGEDHRGGGIDYYLEAVDPAQNVATSPEDGASDPYHFRIAE